MKTSKAVGVTAPDIYRRVTAYEYGIWHRCGIDQAARRLDAERDDVLFCQRWLLANIEPGPVAVYRVNFELLKYMFDQDAGSAGAALTKWQLDRADRLTHAPRGCVQKRGARSDQVRS